MPQEPFTVQNAFNGGVRNVFQADRIDVRTGPAPVGPQEGPAVRREWTGRERDLELVGEALERGRPVALGGEVGMGKTAVAAMAIDRNRGRFPDGQVYIDLDGEEASQAMHSALVRLGVDPGQIPSGLEGRSALYQSVTRNLSLFVVVDGVTRAREAALFQPASTRAGYLVVTQVALRDPGFFEHALGPLEPEAAAEYLRRACPNLSEGVPRRLIEEFGSKPADLRGLAGLIRLRSLSGLIEVREALDGASLFAGLYSGLSESAKWLYRLLSTIPNREFERALTGIFTGSRDWTLESVPRPFAELLDAQLVGEHRPGWYRVETDIAGAAEPPSPNESVPLELFSAAHDSLAWHVRRAQLADQAVMNDRLRFAPRLPARVSAPGFSERSTAMEWFRTLYPALHESVLIAARHGWSDLAWILAEALWAYYANASRSREAATCYRAALAVADGPIAVGHLSSLLGMCLIDTGDCVEAGQILDRGLEAVDDAGDAIDETSRKTLEGILSEVLGRLRHRERRFEEAVDLLQRSRALAEEIERPKAVGIRLRALAEVHRDQGHDELAERAWALAAECFEQAGDERNLDGARLDIAVLRFRRGEDAALPEADRLSDRFRGAGLWQTAAETQERLAESLAERGEPHRNRLERALRLYEAHGAVVDADRVRRLLRVSE